MEALSGDLRRASYFADEGLATAIFLALTLGRPLLLEGEPGVGKTEVAKVLSRITGRRLLRLQCHEGLDLASAVYEWDYGRQLLAIRLLEASAADAETMRRRIFSREFLLARPLLEAIDPARPEDAGPVLLIDELDRADEEFEAFLLELLSDFQISIPEIGTVRAAVPPLVVLTSNRTREIHDALRRRCLYHWLDYPSFDKELAIVRAKVPQVAERLADEVVRFVQALRGEDLYKRPGVAETLDWAAGLAALGVERLTPQAVEATLGLLVKFQEDVAAVKERVGRVGV
ncbi:MAG TPA: MoxR family ATPase [Thermoanaerobaculia bacterium]|nr:MoxR family ATPase [Thermoanaerobaculia bacterium]